MTRRFTKILAALALLVFMMPSMAGWGQTRAIETFSYSAYSGQGTSGSGSNCTATQNEITITSTKGYGTESHVREYSGSDITISGEGVTITKIEVTCTASGTSNYGPSKLGIPSGGVGEYSYSGYVGTWSGNTQPVTLHANAQCRWTQIVVTYTSGGGTPTCATPTFSPAAGAVSANTEVTINCTTEGATIYYTMGDNPADPTTGSDAYDPNNKPVITAATTIKAIAVKDNYNNSEIATASYRIKVQVPGYVIDFENDLDCYVDWEFTNIGIHTSGLSDGAHGGNAWGSNVNESGNATQTASIMTTAVVEYPNVFTCYISKETSNNTASSWKIQVSSDGSSWNDIATLSSMTQNTWTEFTGDIKAAGYTNVFVRLYYSGSNAKRAVDDISLTTYTPAAVEEPVITVTSPFTISTSVSISCITEGATIYYTTDGNDPTTSSSVYSEPFTINSTTTIKAMAVKDSDESTIAEVTAVKELATPTVEISSLNIDVNGTATITTDGPALTLTTSDASVASVSGTTVTGVAAGTATITATWSANNDYSGGTKDFTIVVTDPNAGAGTILFGNQGTNINAASVTGTDSNENTWTITTVGTTSFTQSTEYSQVGSASKPATSITFTTTLPNSVNITSFSAKFGGNNGTTGVVTLIVGETTVGTGSLNESNDVTVSNTDEATGTVLTVTVTNIDKGVKCYFISYEYEVASPVLELPITANQWYLIASPVTEDITPSTGNGFLSPGYNLYSFNQAKEKEWMNFDGDVSTDNPGHFNIESGKGYLYANTNSNGTTLVFAGTPNDSDSKNVTLIKTENVGFSGWNLVGNPFPVEANIGTKAFYRLNNGTELVSATGGINAMEGIFVLATEDGEEITFSKQSAKGTEQVAVNLSQNRGNLVDRAIIRFDEGNTLPKFMLNQNNTKLYIPQDGQDYAVVRSEGQGELPVNFRASENGTYTLSMDVENMDMNYLHLIDNMTGMDIDLLQTPSYTFEAKVNDYESRFRLVFAANNGDGASTGSTTFAFYSNSSWIINNAGEATLQVVDLTGRILSSETVNGSVSKTINAVPGIYMLRLINGDNVNVQKIVVR